MEQSRFQTHLCISCGALVLDEERHVEWHMKVGVNELIAVFPIVQTESGDWVHPFD